MPITTIITEILVGVITQPNCPSMYTTMVGEALAGAGMIHGYGMLVGAGEASAGAGAGTTLGDGIAGAGEASAGAGMLAGAGEATAGVGTTGAGQATVGAGTMAFTIEMLHLIEPEGAIQIMLWPVMHYEEDLT